VRSRVVTLLTDFGTDDYFVAAIKGVILTRNPSAAIVDITHTIPPHDIFAAAFTLGAVYSYFPAGTIHLAVIDPGVGSERRPILVETSEYLFVGPDNGLFSIVLERASEPRVRHLTNSAYFLPILSSTFHARDLFAPVAAALADDVLPETFGPIIKDPIRLSPVQNELTMEGALVGSILHIDHFGNCVTSFESDRFGKLAAAQGFCLSIKGINIREWHKHYNEPGSKAGEPFLVAGSAGYMEMSLSCSSAARKFNISVGEPVRLTWSS
jgi:S-adenosyl-L-methionine hydrolase (adenosine-forming)